MERKPFLKKAGKTVLLALTISTLIFSCKKIEEKHLSSTPGHQTGSTRSGDGGDDGYDDGLGNDEIHAQITHLVEVIWNHSSDQWDAVKPTNETEALEYMEAVLNYTHGDASKDNSEMETYSQEFALPADADGNYTLDVYTESFNTMSDYIVGIYNGIEDPDKNVLAVNLEPVMEAPHTVKLSFYLGKGPYKEKQYSLKTFTSPVYDIYKYDRVSGYCSIGGGMDGACVKLETYGRWNMEWYKTAGGTLLRPYGYYSRVNSAYLDITKLPLLTGPNRPTSFTAGFIDFQIFAYDSWKGLVSMPCINMDQLNYYLSQIKPLYDAAVKNLPTKEFINLTVNPKYKSGGSFTNLMGWGNPGAKGLNTTGPVTGGGDIVTKAANNASGKGTYYEHYYIFDYGRYIYSMPTYRKL